MDEASTQPFAPLWLILTIGVFAIAGSAVVTRLTGAHGVVVAAYRLWIAAALALPPALLSLRGQHVTARHVALIAASGTFLALHFATWLMSLAYVSIAVSVTLTNTAPVWVALFAWIWSRQRPKRGTIVGISIAMFGGIIIAGTGASGNVSLTGVSLALAGAVSVAGYLLISEHVQQAGVPSAGYIGLTYAAAAVVITPAPALFGEPYGGYSLATYGWFALLALGPQLIGHSSLNYATRFVSPTLVSTVALLEPFGAALLAWFVFSELPPFTTITGSVVLVAGLIVTARHTRSRIRVVQQE